MNEKDYPHGYSASLIYRPPVSDEYYGTSVILDKNVRLNLDDMTVSERIFWIAHWRFISRVFGKASKVVDAKLADVSLHDSSGKEIEIPVCEKCGNLKQVVIGKEAFMWICQECYDE